MDYYDIFISYKRKSLPTANNLYYRLTTRGYSTFFDLEDMGRDNFNVQLHNYIENAKDIFIILEEGSLDACKTDHWEKDWFCHEIAFALEKGKNIIPILINGYQMPPVDFFPDKLKELSYKNAPDFHFSFFEAYLDKLIENGYLLSKSNIEGKPTSIFKFYSNKNCQVFKEGKLVCSLEGMSDEPYYLPVSRKGDYRFKVVNVITGESRQLNEQIDRSEEKNIDITWEDIIQPVVYDVFISYSRKDYVDKNKIIIPGNIICAIKEKLRQNGISYWMDEEGNLTGKKFAHIIAGKIRESMVFLFVCSHNSVASRWVDRELSVADTLNKHIIPLVCDDSYLDDKVIMFTSSLDRIDYYTNPEKELEKLISTIEKDKKENETRCRQEEITQRKTEDNSSSTVEVHIDVDADCDLFRFKTFMQHLIAGEDNVVYMNVGKYKLGFVSSEFPEVKSNMVYDLATGITCDFIEISIKEKIDGLIAKRKTEELKFKLEEEEANIIALPQPTDDVVERTYDIFICFRRESGRNCARAIQLSLEKEYSVFMDYDALPYNEFELSIAGIIRNSSVFLLILSKGSLDRCVYENDWVRKEILYAEQFGCHIVPVVVGNSFEGLPESLPEELYHTIGSIQWSNVHMGSLFDVSLDKLVHDRIAPHIHCKKTSSHIGVRKVKNTKHLDTIGPSSIIISEVSKTQPFGKMAAVSPHDKHKVFVSYSRDNIEIAQLFCEQMDNMGISYWIDINGNYCGNNFREVLANAIDSSQVMLFLSSQESNQSPFVIKEISFAVSCNKTILPIKLDDAPYARSIRFDLSDIDWIEFSKDICEEALEKFKYCLQLYLQ